MKQDRDGLDERQKQVRDKIGNQSFFLIFYLIMLDSALYAAGLRWLNYPANVMVIIMVVMGINLVRIILHNAYVGPTTKKRSVLGLLIAAAISIGIAVLVLSTDLRNRLNAGAAGAGDNSAMILFFVSSIILVIALVVSIIKKRQNKDE